MRVSEVMSDFLSTTVLVQSDHAELLESIIRLSADLSAVARHARHMPPEFLSARNNVSPAFYDYCQPLVGDLPRLERF